MNEPVTDSRSQFVVKANEIVRQSRFSMTTLQQKAYLFLISKIKPDDDGSKPYIFSVQDFIRACGLSSSGENYKSVKEALIAIGSIRFWIEGENKSKLRGLLDKIDIDHASGNLECYFHEDVKPFLLHLRENYTQYEIQQVLAMRSKYTIRLYEIAKSYQYLSDFEMSVSDLQKALDAENYQEYKVFKRRALMPALEEINEMSDINLSYVESKSGQTGRKVTSIAFKITLKDDNEQWLAEKERERIYGKNAETDRG
jgi:plasmid replication initiation protein